MPKKFLYLTQGSFNAVNDQLSILTFLKFLRLSTHKVKESRKTIVSTARLTMLTRKIDRHLTLLLLSGLQTSFFTLTMLGNVQFKKELIWWKVSIFVLQVEEDERSSHRADCRESCAC